MDKISMSTFTNNMSSKLNLLIESDRHVSDVINKDNYIYFDCEFTGLRKDTDLISIGFITSSGRTFYAEFTDYNEKYVDNWIRDNVIDNLVLSKIGSNTHIGFDTEHWNVKGDREYVRSMLILWLEWLKRDKDDEFKYQFVSDVCHYDFVLLIDLLSGGKSAFDIPTYISPVCIDINQYIALALTKDMCDLSSYRYRVHTSSCTNINNPNTIAFDLNREEIAEILCDKKYNEKSKHNSLHDAIVIRDIHRAMWGLD